MIVRPIKTIRVKPNSSSIYDILDEFLPSLEERSIVAITSKLVSICEGALAPYDKANIEALVKAEADYYLPAQKGMRRLTVTRNILNPKVGIDVSREKKYFILWPRNPQKTANNICHYLKSKRGLKKLGIVITDSSTTPLRRGVTGIALAHSGFLATRKTKTDTRSNIAQGLAATAVVTMGEGQEQTPLAIISDVPFVKFKDKHPSTAELKMLKLSFEEDIYGQLLTSVNWQKNKQ